MPGRMVMIAPKLEAKENLAIQFENQTLASITYQNYFKLYNKICGCTEQQLLKHKNFSKFISKSYSDTNK